MSLIKVDAIEAFNSEQVTINSDVKFIGAICATTIYVGDTTVITSGGTGLNPGYIWLLSQPITPSVTSTPSDNYFNIQLLLGVTSNTLSVGNSLKIKVNDGDTSSTNRSVWWNTLYQSHINGLLQITYAGDALITSTLKISSMVDEPWGWSINGTIISGPPLGKTFPVYERHYLSWSFGPSSGGTGGTFTGNSFNQSSDFAINTGNTVNITGTNSITYFEFNYIDPSNIDVYAYSNGFISSTTSAFTVNGDYSVHIANLPITTTTFYIDDDNGNGFNLNEYKYTLPIISDIIYDGGLGISTFLFSPILETTYYDYEGIGSSTSGVYSTAEGVSVNALGDYSHVEGAFSNTGTWAYYSSSIVDGVITIENMKPNDRYNILTIEKNNKIFIIFDDNNYEDNYGYEYFSYTSSTYNASAQTYTIYLENNSINTPEALIACNDSKSPYTIPFKGYQHAEGYSTIAIGDNSHSEGMFTLALGEGSHAEGGGTTALEYASHAEGEGTIAAGYGSHAEGDTTETHNDYSHAEGVSTRTYGYGSHAEGIRTFAMNEYSHTEGSGTFTPSVYTYITSVDTNTDTITVINPDIFSVGDSVVYVRNANGNSVRRTYIKSIDITGKTFTLDNTSDIDNNVFWGLNGNLSTIGVLFKLESDTDGENAHSEGSFTAAIGENSHAEGRKNAALGNHSHAEGVIVQAGGTASHAEGKLTQSNGDYSHAEGDSNKSGINAIPALVVDTTTLRLDSSFGDLTKSISFYDLSYGDLRYYYKNNTQIEFDVLDSTIVEYDGIYTFITAATSLPSYLTGTTISVYNPRFSRIENEQIYPDSGLYDRFGESSHAEGYQTLSLGEGSHSEGEDTISFGDFSHAEGYNTQSIGYASHAEGEDTETIGYASHSEGYSTKAIGDYSHSEGNNTRAGSRGYYVTNVVNGYIELNSYSSSDLTDVFIVGESIIFDDRDDANVYGFVQTTISASTYDGTYTYVTCDNTLINAIGNYAYIYLPNNPNPRLADQSIGRYSHAEGDSTIAVGYASHTEGYQTFAFGEGSHSEGESTVSFGDFSHAEGLSTESIGDHSHAEGNSTEAIGDDSHAEGFNTLSLGEGSHAEGELTVSGLRGYYSPGITNGYFALSEPSYVNNDLTDVFIVGQQIIFDDRDNLNVYGFVQTTISASTYDGTYTWITCDNTSINGAGLIYLGNNDNPRLADQSIGSFSHAEGTGTYSIGRYSHAEGYNTQSIGKYSHSEGMFTIALGEGSHASGKYNKSGNTDSIMVVGNGTNDNNRSDIFYINQNSVNVEGRFDNGYRTYRALLTHTDSQTLTETPSFGLIVGETYKILVYEPGDDFLNVGATTNVTEEIFTATSRIPTSWVCGSTLTVETPTFIVNVLENSFEDEIVWELNPFGEGTYGAYFSGGNQTFPREKTSIVATPTSPYGFIPFITQPTIYSFIESDGQIDNYLVLGVNTFDGSNNYNYDGLLWNTPIEIKSYVGFKPSVYLNSYTPDYGNGTADFNVTLASSGSSTVTEFGVVWSMTPNPTIADYKQIFGTAIGTGSYTVDFNGTTFGDYTYVRAYAINRAGVAYHEVNQISFIPND